MDPDMNKYDLEHVTANHPLMTREEWYATYMEAWRAFYTIDHVEVILKRAAAYGISLGKTLFLLVWFYGNKMFEGTHPVEGGYFRLKYRRDRRPSFPIESRFTFYPRYAWHLIYSHAGILTIAWRYNRIRRRLKKDPNARNYTDVALSPVVDAEMDKLELFTSTEEAKAVVAKTRRREARRAAMVAAQ